jgi:LacI family transcriptional regulator
MPQVVEFPHGLLDLGIMSPSDLRPAVARLAMDTKGVGIVALDRPSTRDALAEVVESGIRVVTLLSDVPAALRSAYVGLDNTVAGRTAALLMGRLLDRGSGRGRGTIAILTGSRSYRGHEEREIGFRFVLSEGFPNLVVADAVEINDESEGGYVAARNLLRTEADLVGIYCVGVANPG